MARWSPRVTADWDIRLAFEPGRLISGNAGVLLTRVVRVKPGETHPWLIVDAAMNDLMRPALYDAYHHDRRGRARRGRRMTAHVVGPVCESGDTFAMAREMDAVGDGDLIVFRTAGAYGAAMSSGYNSRPLTARSAGRRRPLGAGPPRRSTWPKSSAMPLPAWLRLLAPALVQRGAFRRRHRAVRRRSLSISAGRRGSSPAAMR